ncbi:MAG: hypothetical protein MJK10_14660 [Pseudomonadales bacterium]|nr:hypothetical protein [Pseudomonadales bacterium]NRA17123.1 hypothetical protein [Oceanospirillaceae bacterium]
MHALLLASVKNNASWCETVSAGQGHLGKTTDKLWYNTGQVPMYYPNLVTLDPQLCAEYDQVIAQLSALDPQPNWGIKDSFASLPLDSKGFFEHFSASWFSRSEQLALGVQQDSDSEILVIKTVAQLQQWERAWSGSQNISSTGTAIFADQLLQQDRVVFLATLKNNKLINGMIAFSDSGVISISNLFSLELSDFSLLAPLIERSWQLLGRQAIVGYDDPQQIIKAKDYGFNSIGDLTVWLKNA